MSDQDCVYGVFSDNKTALALVSELHEAGIETQEICVLGNKSDEFSYISGRIQDPIVNHFLKFGIVGSLLGAWAGIAGVQHIPHVTFQILIPLMAAISGGVVFAYFSLYMCAFFNSNKPQYWANVFEGSVENGNIIVLVEPKSEAQRIAVIKILDAHAPVELVFKRNAPRKAVLQPFSPTIVPEKPEQETTLSVVA